MTRRQQWNTVERVLGVSQEFESVIAEVTDRHGPELTLESLACTVGRWFACQDQKHINAQGFNPQQLMHHMVDYYFQRELDIQAAERQALKDSFRVIEP